MSDRRPVSVAVDAVVFSIETAADDLVDARPVVLLRRRERPPYEGAWVLPGGAVDPGEDLREAVQRVLAGIGGLGEPRHLEQLATFGRPDRDPRGRVVSVSYLGLMPRPAPVAGEARWWRVDEPLGLGFDHDEILTTAMDRLRGKLSYSNVAYGLLPERFTLSELQQVYEAVLQRTVDKRNFRKKVLSLGMLAETQGQRRGSHRPAQLYRFARRELVLLDDAIT